MSVHKIKKFAKTTLVTLLGIVLFIIFTPFIMARAAARLLLKGLKLAARLPQHIRLIMRRTSSDMTEDETLWFWDIIDKSNCDRETLYNILRKMNKHEIIRFRQCFINTAAALKTSQHCALRREDDINDICHWVVSQGRSLYLVVLDNPEMMPHNVDELTDKILYDVADKLFYTKYNRTISLK